MKWSWKIGTIAGIPTRIHATFALVLAWAAYSGYSSSYPVLSIAVSVGILLAVFASVLLHELGHALTARRYGIGTRHITLLPIGGVAALDEIPQEPKAEFWIALAGPLVNVALASIFGLVSLGLSELAAPGFVVSVAATLAVANVGLALFNMIPAFPMDGGRVFRAWLQGRQGRLKATETAASVGKVFAGAFAVYGLFNNPMLLLLAPFLWLAADTELRQTRLMAARAREFAGRWWPGGRVAPAPVTVRVIEVPWRQSRRL